MWKILLYFLQKYTVANVKLSVFNKDIENNLVCNMGFSNKLMAVHHITYIDTQTYIITKKLNKELNSDVNYHFY